MKGFVSVNRSNTFLQKRAFVVVVSAIANRAAGKGGAGFFPRSFLPGMARDDTVGDLVSVGPGPSTDTPPGRPKRRVTPSVITLEVGDTRQLKNKSTSPVPVADDPESMFLETLAAFLGARHAMEVTHNAQMAGDENVGNVSGGHLHLHPQTQKMHVPIFCREKLRLNALFDQVARQGGYHVVCRHKLWHRVCVELGFDLTGQTSASYAMRRYVLRVSQIPDD